MSKIAQRRRTTSPHVTTMEEVPVLDGDEQAALLGILKDAEADIKAGKGVEYDPRILADRLIGIYRGNKR